jgi:hypothetical protein
MRHNVDYAWSGFRSSRKEHAAGASSTTATACCHQHPVAQKGNPSQVWHLNVVLSFRCAIYPHRACKICKKLLWVMAVRMQSSEHLVHQTKNTYLHTWSHGHLLQKQWRSSVPAAYDERGNILCMYIWCRQKFRLSLILLVVWHW